MGMTLEEDGMAERRAVGPRAGKPECLGQRHKFRAFGHRDLDRARRWINRFFLERYGHPAALIDGCKIRKWELQKLETTIDPQASQHQRPSFLFIPDPPLP